MNDGLELSFEGPEFILELVHNSATVLRNAGLSSESAKDIAIEIAMSQAERWGGHQIYFPKAKGTWNSRQLFCTKMEDQDWKIYHEYNGTNRQEICKKYGIKRTRLYQIVKACRQKILDHHSLTRTAKQPTSTR